MLQGTGSDVGKSLLVAGICRAALRRGLRVRPFKPQNMSNNAAVTADGGEIGRAQALQARACGVPPVSDMNPVLLKPQSDIGAQVIVQGRMIGSAKAREFQDMKPRLLGAVQESFGRLMAESDLVVVEGAGSAAEINLRAGDIANMGFAEIADLPVLLVGDIDRGGVIAQLVGTHALLDRSERARVCGFIVNKFRGDLALFEGGTREITRRTGWSSFGTVPWFADAARLPAEDAMGLERPAAQRDGRPLKIAICAYPRISNFDEFDPLAQEPEVELTFVRRGPLPPDADLIVLPGSKSTLADLSFLRSEGWHIDIVAAVRQGRHVLGVCGGLQMLGRNVADPGGIEGAPAEAEGLGLLQLSTSLEPTKVLREVVGTDRLSGARVRGYEMHVGVTTGPDLERPMFVVDGRPEGAASADGLVGGTYLHGVFAADEFRGAYLRRLRADMNSELKYEAGVDATLDGLARHVEKYLAMDRILSIAASWKESAGLRHG